MSMTQTLGILVTRAAMLVLFFVIAAFSVLVAWKSASFAWTQSGSIGTGLGLVAAAIVLEIAKDWLPVIYYNQRHDAPRMATGVMVMFMILLAISYTCSMWYENSEGTNRMSNILLFIGHGFAAGGPLVWVNASKWIEERPTDGLPRAPTEVIPAPMQQEAIPGPKFTVRDAFSEWVPRMLSQDKDGQVPLTKALDSFNGWASSHGYPTADPHSFEALMTEMAGMSGGFLSNGYVMGVSLVGEAHYLPVH